PVNIIVDIGDIQDHNQTQEYIYQLVLDESLEIPIVSAKFNAGDLASGNTLNLDLADKDNYDEVITAQTFTFRIGSIENGDTIWKEYITNGILNSLNYSIVRQNNAPLT